MGNIPLWLCIPFAGLLLCIAIFPLVKGEWWDKNKGWAVLIWSLLFIIPFAVKYGAGETAETVLECIVNDYLSFIVLLFGLFCVSGNINLEGDFVGSPRMNTGLLAIGTLLSSCIGTTGASMLLVRPMIQMNSWRRNKSHIMVFFIFLISNMGGCLTPIGDPPLLMGFMRGVPFTWSLRLFPVLIFNMVILLTVFYFIDRRAYRRDIALGMRPDISRPTTTLKVNGLQTDYHVKGEWSAQYYLYDYDCGRCCIKWRSSGNESFPECRWKCHQRSDLSKCKTGCADTDRDCDYSGCGISVV